MKKLEHMIEMLIFSGRWLMAPIYLGLLLILAAITVKFVEELIFALPNILHMQEREWVIFVLSLVDLALLANLVTMIIFVGYENFVSRLHTGDNEDRPIWMEHVDFSGLKIKLIGSIVAISAIHLLQTFMNISGFSKADVAWQLAIHLGFVVSGLLLAVMDRLVAPPVEKGKDS
ncbi:TIGR00645 family protein [Acidisoma sp. 7E03]